MKKGMTRREFIGATTAGAVGMAAGGSIVRAAGTQGGHEKLATSKVRVGKVYLGGRGGWPSPKLDPKDDIRRIEAELAKLKPELADVEFVEGGHVTNPQQMPAVKKKFRDVDGIIAIHLCLGTGRFVKELVTLGIPTVFFSLPYMGHEWTTIVPQYKQGKKIELLATSEFSDLVLSMRSFRAIHYLKRAKILSFRGGEAYPEYVKGIKDRFGSEIKFMPRQRLIEAYNAVDQKLAQAEAERWIRGAEKIVEPTREDILKGSRLYFAMRKILEEEKAHLITIRYCMGIPGLAGAYPCLGFSRLNGEGFGGICEGDLSASMTYLIFMYLTPKRKPGFVSDPVIDTSNDTIMHAHCTCAVKMDGAQGEQCPYIIRNQQEGQRGACLQVKMRVGQEITMAKLIGDDTMLISTGKITEVPDVERGCRTKIKTKVENTRKVADNWHYGLHRVIFYGDHMDDIARLSRFLGFKVIHEGVDEVHPPAAQIERDTNVYASYPI